MQSGPAQTEWKKITHRYPVATGGLLFACLIFYYWLSGTLMPKAWSPFWTSSLQLTGIALSNSAIPAFLVGSFGYGIRRTAEMVRQLLDDDVIDRKAAEARLTEIVELPLRARIIASTIGIVLSAFNLPWIYMHAAFTGDTPMMDVSVMVGTVILWVIVANVSYRGIRNARILFRIGRDDATVDLFSLNRLAPFGKIATLNILIVVGALSLMPLQSLDAELRVYNYLNGLLIGIPVAIVLFGLPLVGIRARIRDAKRDELAQLDQAIQSADRQLGSNDLAHLNALLERRDRIAATREWPLDMTAYRRVALYVVIPPMAWVGAALVEIALNSALD
jgi:hypothetical protein